MAPVAVPEPKMGSVSHSEVTAEDKYTPKDRSLKAQKSYVEREGAVLLITKASMPASGLWKLTVIHEINESLKNTILKSQAKRVSFELKQRVFPNKKRKTSCYSESKPRESPLLGKRPRILAKQSQTLGLCWARPIPTTKKPARGQDKRPVSMTPRKAASRNVSTDSSGLWKFLTSTGYQVYDGILENFTPRLLYKTLD